MPALKGIPAAQSPRVPEDASVAVHLPRDKELSRLLAGTGGRFEKFLNQMAGAASPDHAHRVVTFSQSIEPGVAEDLAALLAKARAAGDPAADALAGVAAQLGVSEPEPAVQEPPAVSGPRPAPRAGGGA